jgi:hypothetical protein
MDFWSTDRCRADAQRDESGAISRETVTAVTFKPLLSVDTYTKFSSFSMDLSPQSQKTDEMANRADRLNTAP